MANLVDLAAEVKNDGYSQVNAEAKVCQDIVLKAISKSMIALSFTKCLLIFSFPVVTI